VFGTAGSTTNGRVPHPPEFPVRLGGVNQPHAAFLEESRTRCHGWGPRSRKSGVLCALCKGWDTRRSVSRFVVSHPSQTTRRMGHPGICCTSAVDRKCPVSYPVGRQRRWMTEKPSSPEGTAERISHIHTSAWIEAPPSPLSSRPKRRDLQFALRPQKIALKIRTTLIPAGNGAARLQATQCPQGSPCWPDYEWAERANVPGRESRYPTVDQGKGAASDRA
jgi:hypothetical protein